MKKILKLMLYSGLILCLSCGSDEVESDCIGKVTYTACTDHYAPVCGCDGKTYGNGCYAASSGVKRYTEGTCE